MINLGVGKYIVFGVPPIIKQITGLPRGAKCRLRFRAGSPAKVFVRTAATQISAHHIETIPNVSSGVWVLGPALGLNQRN